MFPTKVLLATDGSEDAARAARMAVELSERLDSPLHVVYVEPLHDPYPVVEATLYNPALLLPVREIAGKKADERLDEETMKVGSLGEVSGAHARVGKPDVEIVRLAEEIGAGLIVVGSRGLGGVRRALLGSTSGSVVRHAHVPVLVVRDGGHAGGRLPGRILAAVDGSGEADAAAGVAAEISAATGSELHIVFALPTDPIAPFPFTREEWEAQNDRSRHAAREFVDSKAAEMESAGAGLKDAHLVLGEPQKEIVRLGEELESGLIVVGSRGLGGLARALTGSVSDAVVRHAHCPVLVVR
ncbi:MAG: universal stress protein [Rubrobacter sp.]